MSVIVHRTIVVECAEPSAWLSCSSLEEFGHQLQVICRDESKVGDSRRFEQFHDVSA
jgi:hypothetical protein